MLHSNSYYSVQVARDLHVHAAACGIKPEAPLLVLLGNVGDPLDVSFDAFLAWASRQWQRVFLVPGALEAAEPLVTEGTCMRHNNVTLLKLGITDTSLAGLALTATGTAPELLCATRGLPDVTLQATGVHRVAVTPPVTAVEVEEGWARTPPAVAHEWNSGAPPCRVCGYTTHTTAECPFSWAEKMRHANKRVWRADQSRWRGPPGPQRQGPPGPQSLPSQLPPSLCASAPALIG